MKRLHLLMALAVALAISSCAGWKSNKNTQYNETGDRAVASLTDCPQAKEAFENTRAHYNDCFLYGRNCDLFCREADGLIAGPGPGPDVPPRPTDPCDPMTPEGRDQERTDSRATGSSTVTVYGNSERECIDYVRSNRTYQDSAISNCNYNVKCDRNKNCRVDRDRDINIVELKPVNSYNVDIGNKIHKENCGKQPGSPVCAQMCRDSLPRIMEQRKSECQNMPGVRSCTATMGAITEWYKDGHSRCSASVTLTPQGVSSRCTVSVRANNRGRWDNGRGGWRD